MLVSARWAQTRPASGWGGTTGSCASALMNAQSIGSFIGTWNFAIVSYWVNVKKMAHHHTPAPGARGGGARLLASPFVRAASSRQARPASDLGEAKVIFEGEGEIEGAAVPVAAVPAPPAWARAAAPVLVAVLVLRACLSPSRVDCVLAPWPEEWGACSTSCGARAGTQTRARAVATYAAHGGRPCPLDSRETLQERPCNARPCPVHCRLHAWGEWSDCSRSCGGGVQLREPRVRQWPAHGGQPCPGTERRAGGTQPCPSAWQIWK